MNARHDIGSLRAFSYFCKNRPIGILFSTVVGYVCTGEFFWAAGYRVYVPVILALSIMSRLPLLYAPPCLSFRPALVLTRSA